MTEQPTPPLVEAYGVRWGNDSRYKGSLTDLTDSRPDAQREVDYAEDKAGTGWVVPLIAADRLTDDALLEAICRRMLDAVRAEGGAQGDQGSWLTLYRETTRETLAALRVHLEAPT